MTSPLQRLYKTKLTLLAVCLTVSGLALLFLAKWASTTANWYWLSGWPLAEAGSTLFIAGLFTVALEYMDARDAQERGKEHFREVLHEEAPALRDAVIDGFAFNADDLSRVASPQLLDDIIRNCLAIRLGDRQLADDLYTDLCNQVVRTDERRFDMHVAVSLSPWEPGPAVGSGAMFVATVRREYDVVPGHQVRRFSCVSDLGEYRQLLLDPTTTEVSYFEPVTGLDATSPQVYELLQFTVDGRPRPIRRTERKGVQVFTVNLGAKAEVPDKPVRLTYTYRMLVQQHGHLLYLDIGQPCKGVRIDFTYGNCGIRHVSVLDFIASAQSTQVLRSPRAVPTPSVSISFDGWVFPKSGVAFVWVLDSEMSKATS